MGALHPWLAVSILDERVVIERGYAHYPRHPGGVEVGDESVGNSLRRFPTGGLAVALSEVVPPDYRRKPCGAAGQPNDSLLALNEHMVLLKYG